jgi:hypothetical protein
MKKFPKTVGVVAVANLCCFWVAYGLMSAAWRHVTLGQFLGFVPAPPPSHSQTFLVWIFVILGAPTSIMLDGVSSEYLMPLLVLSSVLNCIIWGVCLGFPIYAVSKRLRNVAA